MLKHKITGVILAGGASKRMGRSKAQLQLGDKRMIEWIVTALDCLFDEIIVVTHHPQTFSTLENVRFVQDAIESKTRSSLVGLYTGLLHSSNETVFVVPCDMPLLNRALIEHMISLLEGEDVRVPVIGQHFQPLHAFYRKSCLSPIKQSIDCGAFKVTVFYDEVLVRTVDEATVRSFDRELWCFTNINSEADYLQAKELWKTSAGSWMRQWSDANCMNMKRGKQDVKHRSAHHSQRKRQNSYI